MLSPCCRSYDSFSIFACARRTTAKRVSAKPIQGSISEEVSALLSNQANSSQLSLNSILLLSFTESD